MTRGNHETCAMNKVYGFEGEVSHKHSKHVYDCFVDVFKHLPLAVTLNNNVFICHGGLFNDDRVSIDDIKKVGRQTLNSNRTKLPCNFEGWSLSTGHGGANWCWCLHFLSVLV